MKIKCNVYIACLYFIIIISDYPCVNTIFLATMQIWTLFSQSISTFSFCVNQSVCIYYKHVYFYKMKKVALHTRDYRIIQLQLKSIQLVQVPKKEMFIQVASTNPVAVAYYCCYFSSLFILSILLFPLGFLLGFLLVVHSDKIFYLL